MCVNPIRLSNRKGRGKNVTDRGNIECEQANVFRHRADIAQSLDDHRVRPELLQEVVALLHERRGVRFDGILCDRDGDTSGRRDQGGRGRRSRGRGRRSIVRGWGHVLRRMLGAVDGWDDLHRGRMRDNARDGRTLDLAFQLERYIVEPAIRQPNQTSISP